MKELDKSKAYDLKDLSSEQLMELLEWLIKNDADWEWYDIDILKKCRFIGFSNFSNEWVFGDCNKEVINALELFQNMKEITEEQIEQLINLNDSMVNEILGVNPKLENDTWYVYNDGTLQFNIKHGEGYGITSKNEWIDEVCWLKHDVNGAFRKASYENVENALIKEAKRRGFKRGFNYDHVYNELWCNSEMIFSKGNWDKPKPNKQEIINQINELLNLL